MGETNKPLENTASLKNSYARMYVHDLVWAPQAATANNKSNNSNDKKKEKSKQQE